MTETAPRTGGGRQFATALAIGLPLWWAPVALAADCWVAITCW